MAYKQFYNLPPLRGTTVTHGSGTAVPTGPDFGVSVNAQRVAAMTPSGVNPADYEYQFRPGPTVSAQRVADMSQTLAAGESFANYEIQVR